jgi:hypothetical protein
MDRVCYTRAIKNAKHLQVATTLFSETEPPEGFFSVVPGDLLLRLASLRPEEVKPPALREALQRSKPSIPRTSAAQPLFSGTVFLVHVNFSAPGGPFTVSEEDMNVALDFLTLSAPTISRYASQYGPNILAISNRLVPFSTMLSETSYNDKTLSEWVDQIVAENAFSKNSCIAFMNPEGVLNVDADPRQGVLGYHSVSPSKVPYAFVNVMGKGLTVNDPNDYFALALSHEIAEMTVDPRADGSSPECCDPCGPNCPPSLRDFFDGSGSYLETSAVFPPPFEYAFYINAIVKPSAATQCPAPELACSYPPPNR